jgi:peptidoglycan hydrolase-like protein with peptidoglycan-binding domain
LRPQYGAFLFPSKVIFMKIKLQKPFARNSKVEEYDVRQIKKALNRLGYYAPLESTGITGIPDAAVFQALKTFQQDQSLPATGTAKPGDETVIALNRQAAKTPDGSYIWRTVEDDKVRSAHVQYNRQIREWADAPDPSEEFNCRCWAESVSTPEYAKTQNDCSELEIEWINAEAQLAIAKQNLDKAQKQKLQLQEQYLQKTKELRKLILQLDKERKDKIEAQYKGAAAGGVIGGILGATKGIGGALAGAGLGIGTGKNIGRYLEEIGDILSDESQNDIALGFQERRAIQEIKTIKKNIENLSNQIETKMAQHVRIKQQETEKIKRELIECKRNFSL